MLCKAVSAMRALGGTNSFSNIAWKRGLAMIRSLLLSECVG